MGWHREQTGYDWVLKPEREGSFKEFVVDEI
jgi:hypothetical protein